MKNILVLTDFSDLSGFAKKLADTVANSIDAKLHLLKIVHVPSEIEMGNHGEPISGMAGDVSKFIKEKEDSEVKMKSWVEDLQSDFTTVVQYGRFSASVEKYIEQESIDLIVMGTHGVTGVQEFLSGSLTESIIKENQVPVLSLKCDRSDLDFSDFLITGNFEEEKVDQLEVLKGLQKAFDSQLHLLTVVTKKHFVTSKEAEEKMRRFVEKNELTQVKYHTYCAEDFESGVQEFADSFDAQNEKGLDILAVQKKHHTTIGYWIHGCEATQFVNHVFRPILTYSCNKNK